MRYHLTPVRMTIIDKSTNSKCWQGCGGKGTLVHCWQEYRLVQTLWKAVGGYLRKLKTELPYDPAIPLLGMYQKKSETLIWKNTCTPMFIAAVFTIANIWKRPKCPSVDEYIKKAVVHSHNGISLDHKKTRNTYLLGQHGWAWRGPYAKWHKPVKEKYHMKSHIFGI